MSYGSEQITEKGHQPRHGKPAKKQGKKNHHRKMRMKLKNLDYVPVYNRYHGWAD